MGSGSSVPRVPQPPKMVAPPASEIDTDVLDIALSRRGGKQPKRSGYITKGQTIGESGQLIQAPKRETASVKAATGQAAFSKKAELKNLEEFNPAGFAQDNVEEQQNICVITHPVLKTHLKNQVGMQECKSIESDKRIKIDYYHNIMLMLKNIINNKLKENNSKQNFKFQKG